MIHASYMMIIDMTAMTDNSGWYDDLQTLVGVAQSKRYRVIAGRVETAASLQSLWKCAVHYLQGNFLREPD